MFKNCSRLMAVLLVSLLLTGCWDATDVSSLNLCTMVILDRQGDELSFTVEIAKISPLGEAGGDGKEQTYLTGRGKDLAEARDNVDMQMDKPIFLGTVRALVITERAAADDLAEYLFRLRENQAYRQKVNISIIREDPQELTGFENEAHPPVGFILDDTIHTGQTLGHTCAITTEKYADDILAKRGFIIQHIGLVDRQIALDGYAVFRDAKLVGFISMADSHGLSYLLSARPIWVYRLPVDARFITAEVELARREIRPSYEEGRIKFEIQLDFKATIQYQTHVSLFPLNEQNIRQYADTLNQVLAQEISTAIEQSQQEFQSDYLDLGDVFRLQYPDEFEGMDWASAYLDADITAHTSVDISVSDKIDIEGS